MSRVKVSDLMRKKMTPLSLSQHIVASLEQHDNKSKIVEEILLENMDRINCGDIEAAIKGKEIHIRDMVIKVLSENECKLLENESNIAKLQEIARTLQEMKLNTYSTTKEFQGIAQEINALTDKINSTDIKRDIVTEITKRIYSDTEVYARSFFEV